MEESLWPCRGVAEHAYCPRLFYYMSVEGIFAPSRDTEEGKAVHRRQDRPSAAPDNVQKLGHPDDDPNRPRSIRSLTLTSERLGLTATLDLTEMSGRVAIPVEYRKGRSCRNLSTDVPGDELMEEPRLLAPAQAWPTDRVQVGLQAILLEEAGYSVPEVVIYYAAEKLRLRLPLDESLRSEALATLAAAKASARGPRPLPLVNDPRCVRCSLQPICLPDEVNQQRLAVDADSSEALEELSPRRLWPPRDDGIHVVTQREGVHVGVRGHALRFTDRDGELVKELPIANLESFVVLGGVQISTQALTVLAEKEVPVAFLTRGGRLAAMMDPLGPVSASVRAAQVKRLGDAAAALELARAVVVAKITNQRTLLMRNHAALPEAVARELAHCIVGAEKAAMMNELRGHEGNAARCYFAHFRGMFKGEADAVGSEFDANGRQRRPPPDPVNAVLSFAYSVLTNECVAACRLASLEPTIGALHTTRPGRPAMALDLLEPFRPLIGDSVAVLTFNRGELTPGHFMRTAAGCALTDAGRKAFFGAYGRRMETVVAHPVFEYRLSYRRMLTLHARMISAWLLGEVPSLAFLTTR